jgi:protein involved in ribonucleotide reduction
MMIAYFSNVSGNTERFIERLEMPAKRIPILPKEPFLDMEEPFVLVCPTYGDKNMKNFVPRQVQKFLNKTENRHLLRGVIASGNINFGEDYAIAGEIISSKCHVPYLYRFELMGTSKDIEAIQHGLERFWLQIPSTESTTISH